MKEIQLQDIQNFIRLHPEKHHSDVLSKISRENLVQGKDYYQRLQRHPHENVYIYFDVQGHGVISKHIIYSDNTSNMYCIILGLTDEGDHIVSEYASIENAKIFDKYIYNYAEHISQISSGSSV